MWRHIAACGKCGIHVGNIPEMLLYIQISAKQVYSPIPRFSAEEIHIYPSKCPPKRSEQGIWGHSERYTAGMMLELHTVPIQAIWSISHLLTVSLWARDTLVQHVCTVEHFRQHFIAHRCLFSSNEHTSRYVLNVGMSNFLHGGFLGQGKQSQHQNCEVSSTS